MAGSEPRFFHDSSQAGNVTTTGRQRGGAEMIQVQIDGAAPRLLKEQGVESVFVNLLVSGSSFENSMAELLVNRQAFAVGTQMQFLAFCSAALGRDAQEWPTWAEHTGLVLHMPYMTAIERNLVKALMLVVLWLEPALIAGSMTGLENDLDDDVIVDYASGAARQRYLYFPDRRLLHRAGAPVIQRLYRNHLLAHLRLSFGDRTRDDYFVPLVTPGIRADKLAGARKTWVAVTRAMYRRVSQMGGAA
jgi:hypothetical protein